MVRLVWFPGYIVIDWERRKYTWEIRRQNPDVRGARSFAQCVSLVFPSEARLYLRSIDIFRRRRRRRRQPKLA